ncbi:hypothetical protein I4U23_001999 [Adineta vaga]|nr:hypothetical protein I4U23_001999 [Adineta vaga]
MTSTNDNNVNSLPTSLEMITSLARSNREWNTVYQYISRHPNDFFVILPGRRYAIAHQVVYHGNVAFFKCFLALFSANQINLDCKTNDDKTFLDIAREKQTIYPDMYTYVEYLYAYNQLINEVRNQNWSSIIGMLNENNQLINQKPPHISCFLLHYIVEYGNAQVLEDLLNQFRFQTNVKNSDDETPLDMATRLCKHDMCSILHAKTNIQSQSHPNQSKSLFCLPIEPAHCHSSKLSLPTAQLSENECDNLAQNVKRDSRSMKETRSVSDVALNQSRPLCLGSIQHRFTRKSIISEESWSDEDSSSSSTTKSSLSNQELMKTLICPLTDKIFVDPVIANDGYTYERTAILDWVNKYHTSPKTNVAMDATFTDNKEIKNIIQSMRS